MKITVRPWRNDKTGKRWEVDIWFKDESGVTQRVREQSMSTSESGSQAWGETRLRELLRHGKAPKRVEKVVVPRVSEFETLYIEECESNRQKPGTIEHKKNVIRIYLVPLLLDAWLDRIGDDCIRDIKSKMKGLSPKTVNNALSVLSTMLKFALAKKLITTMPVIKLLPVPDDGERPFYDFDVYERLVGAAVEVDCRVEVVVRLGAEAGLRLGEMIALDASSVSFARNDLYVQRAWYRGTMGLPKGRRKRHVAMTVALAAALRGLGRTGGRRFLLDDEGESVSEKVVREWMRAAQAKAGIEVNGRIHILRHTFCSHLAMLGVPAKAIQELAGHQDLTTTMRYMHLSPSSKTDAIATLDRRAATSAVAAVAAVAAAAVKQAKPNPALRLVVGSGVDVEGPG